MENNTKQHWENIYKNKTDQELSWYQDQPQTPFNTTQDFIYTIFSRL